MNGIVSDIRRFSLHDGPGIRTAVFFSGCNLRCAWCHNPETYQRDPQLVFVENKCIGCGECYRVCPTGALSMNENGRVYREDLCRKCFLCVEACYPGALTLSGREMTAEQILDEIRADISYYAPTGGGATISGGEPFMQKDLLLAVLRECRNEKIHTCIESNFTYPWNVMEPALKFTDMVMADIKHSDSGEHEKWTGLPNDVILENICRLDKTGIPFIIRTPVIPTVNDNPAAIGAIARFLSCLDNLIRYELLNYNELAELKFESVGLDYALAGTKRLKADQMAFLVGAARDAAPSVEIRYQL